MTKVSLGIVSIKFVTWAMPTCANQSNREDGGETLWEIDRIGAC